MRFGITLQWIHDDKWISANSNQLLEPLDSVLHQFLLRSVGHGFQGIDLNSEAILGSHQCCADETLKKYLKILEMLALNVVLCCADGSKLEMLALTSLNQQVCLVNG